MGYTALQLANLGILKLGEEIRLLAGFDDPGKLAANVNLVFPTVFREVLGADDWSWARVTAELSEDETLTHYTDILYAFDLPADLVTIRLVYHYNGLKIPYRLEQGHLFCNYAAHTDTGGNVYPRMCYTRDALTDTEGDGTGYPMVMTQCDDLIPEYWATAFATRLAWELAKPVTGSTKIREAMRSEYIGVALPIAQQRNAEQDPGEGENEGDWTEVGR